MREAGSYAAGKMLLSRYDHVRFRFSACPEILRRRCRAVRGVRMATASAGIKYKNRTDVLLMVFDKPAAVAGVFTRSTCPSAPVDFCRARTCRTVWPAPSSSIPAMPMPSPARKGQAATELTAKSAAACRRLRRKAKSILASTGVIGEPLDATKFAGVLGEMTAEATGDFWFEAAKAIMTTDTYPKVATRSAEIGGVTVTINGIAKGAGMIAPDMATMLSFVVTDADIAPAALQVAAVRRHRPDLQFGHRRQRYFDLRHADAVCNRCRRQGRSGADRPMRPIRRLQVSRGTERTAEGPVRCRSCAMARAPARWSQSRSTGAESDAAAKRIALSIANSPLVKTAVAGEDANWGRVVMAVGKSGEMADRDRLAIWFGDVRVAVDGERDPAYSEAAASAVMKKQDIPIKRRYSASAPARQRSGPATSQRNMSRSTATTGAEVIVQKHCFRSRSADSFAGWKPWVFAPGRPRPVQYDGSWQVRLTAGHRFKAAEFRQCRSIRPIIAIWKSGWRRRAKHVCEAYGRPLTVAADAADAAGTDCLVMDANGWPAFRRNASS